MFASEAILWNTLRHTNIIPFLGVVELEQGFDVGLVSPFFKNGNIKTYMTRFDRRHWPVLAKGLGIELAKGLKYIHCHQPPVIHGDLKGVRDIQSDLFHRF